MVVLNKMQTQMVVCYKVCILIKGKQLAQARICHVNINTTTQ